MTENDIKKIYQSKIRDFEKHNELYYDKSSPVISDRKFDEIKAEILDLEKNMLFFIAINRHQNLLVLNHPKILKNFNIKFKCCLYLMHLIKKIL